MYETDKRQSRTRDRNRFILLLLLTCAALIGLAVLLWLIPFIGFSNIHPRLPLIMALFFAAVVLYMIGVADLYSLFWGAGTSFSTGR
jgi:hypothetical protein